MFPFRRYSKEIFRVMTKEEKKELQSRIDELQKTIVANSKDAHFAKNLTDEIVKCSKQYVNETELDCGDKVEEFSGNNFRIVKTTRGVLYHEYGGYNIFVTPNNTALYNTLIDLIDLGKSKEGLSDEEKERVELMLSATIQCISVPKIAFLDADFTFEIASKVIDFINTQYDKLMSEPLQEEIIEQDEAFKEAALALEEMKELAKEE